jgi:uncharacterized membrane protein YdjX (TVP38/TMEM64 family)
MTDPGSPPVPDAMAKWRRALPFVALVFGLALFFAAGLDRYLSFEALRANRSVLTGWVAAHGWVAPLAFMGVYAAAVAFSLPAGAILTLAGGFLFGLWWGALYVVIGATIGAILVFLAARSAFRETFRARLGPSLQKMEAGFREDAFFYLLTLRLLPVFPFFLVNLAPAFLGVRLAPYAAATFIGIIPGSFVYASIGAGLGTVFDQGGTPDLGIIFKWEIVGPLIGLAVLSLLPVLAKRMGWMKRDA